MTTAKWRGNPCGNGCCECDCCNQATVRVQVSGFLATPPCAHCEDFNGIYVFDMATAWVLGTLGSAACWREKMLTFNPCGAPWDPAYADFGIARICSGDSQISPFPLPAPFKRIFYFHIISSVGTGLSEFWYYRDESREPFDCNDLSNYSLVHESEPAQASCNGTFIAQLLAS